MKKIPLVIITVIVSLLLVASVPVTNNVCAAANYKRLAALPVPENTVCVDDLSYMGRLVGNGNGMQFFAAMLVSSTQSMQELQAYYTPLGCAVQEQAGQTIERIDGNTLNTTLSFKTALRENTSYYLIYSWGDGIPPFSWLDIRGV